MPSKKVTSSSHGPDFFLKNDEDISNECLVRCFSNFIESKKLTYSKVK